MAAIPVLLLLALAPEAQAVVPQAAPSATVRRPARKRIRIPMWADDGQPLEAKQVEAKLNGAPARVVRLQGPSDPLMLLLILDIVGDMAQAEPAREALASAIRQLPAHTHIGLMRAQDGLGVLLDPTTDREALAGAILAHAASGRAGLLDTVEEATRLGDAILAKAAVRLAVCYITDSNITNYREDFTNPVVNSSDGRDLSRRFPEGLVRERIARVVANLSIRQSPLFVVHLDYRSDRLNEAYQTGLLELAAATGGKAEFCRSNAEIPTAIEKMIQVIAGHWSAEVELPEKRQRQLTVQLDSGGRALSYRNRLLVE